jgi:hypothetical protein
MAVGGWKSDGWSIIYTKTTKTEYAKNLTIGIKVYDRNRNDTV